MGYSKVVKVTGIQNVGRTVSVVVRGSNKLVLEEADRSLHDALCVIRCLVKRGAVIAGGGAPETELSYQLSQIAQTLPGVDAYCMRAFAQALEVGLVATTRFFLASFGSFGGQLKVTGP